MVWMSLQLQERGATEEKLRCQQNKARRTMEGATQTTCRRAQRGQKRAEGKGNPTSAHHTARSGALFSADRPEPAACPQLQTRVAEHRAGALSLGTARTRKL